MAPDASSASGVAAVVGAFVADAEGVGDFEATAERDGVGLADGEAVAEGDADADRDGVADGVADEDVDTEAAGSPPASGVLVVTSGSAVSVLSSPSNRPPAKAAGPTTPA
ncbi:hypothetical protein, partial [Streptomyces sp. NRRL S-15]|uniref:hypothetical protein n=1 Tax=Streptomyces sp. NRRL S-15 TaxID=1463886 RepID=UPI002D218CF3